MAVESRLQAVPREQLGQPLRVLAEPHGIDRGVLDEGNRALAAFPRRAEQTESRLPQLAKARQLLARSRARSTA